MFTDLRYIGLNSAADEVFYGKIECVTDPLTFLGASVTALQSAF
jgi:hypothetical protein